jgi:tRNA/rRNA methyltransferase
MNICIILVEPAVPGNIGASARAMKTMGFKRLRLVNPSDHLCAEAKMFAHASGEILDQAEVYDSLEESLADLDLSIATTARPGNERFEFHEIKELPGIIRKKGRTIENIGVVFGGEESGLSNDEIRKCDLVSTIPIKQSYPSLNLSQAVMIYAYTLADFAASELQRKAATGMEKEIQPSAPEQFRTMMDKTGELLRKLEADRSPALYNRIMERIALLEENDIRLVLSVISRLH